MPEFENIKHLTRNLGIDSFNPHGGLAEYIRKRAPSLKDHLAILMWMSHSGHDLNHRKQIAKLIIDQFGSQLNKTSILGPNSDTDERLLNDLVLCVFVMSLELSEATFEFRLEKIVAEIT